MKGRILNRREKFGDLLIKRHLIGFVHNYRNFLPKTENFKGDLLGIFIHSTNLIIKHSTSDYLNIKEIFINVVAGLLS